MGACSAEEAPHPHRDTEETRRRDLAAAPRSCRDEGALCKQARRVHATPGKHRWRSDKLEKWYPRKDIDAFLKEQGD
jgi:hypothetical protein